jgi:site-specific DNA recombinase
MDKPIKEVRIDSGLRTAIYSRVSTQEQALKKTSIPEQIEECQKVIINKGWIFFKDYKDEGISGHLTVERNGLQSMLREAREHKFDLIIVKDFDRLARDKDAAAKIRKELKELGIQTYAINSPVEPRPLEEYDPEDNDSATIMESISDMRADLERSGINRRMKIGKMIKAKAGKIPNRVPYGYKIIRTLDGIKIIRTIVINEEEAEKIRFIFKAYSEGKGDRKIALEMNKAHWSGPAGLLWSTQTIKYILNNPTYTGQVWWGWRHAEYNRTKEWRRRGKQGYTGKGEHVPIVDEAVFALVKEIRSSRTKGITGGSERSFGVLTGIAKCARCGSGVGYKKRHNNRSRKNPNWNDTITYEYICSGYKYKGICSARVMSADRLETAVLDQIKSVYAHPKVQASLAHNGNNQEEKERAKKILQLEKDIQAGPTKELRHKEAYEKGIETLEELGTNISRIREEVKKYHMELYDLNSVSSATAQRELSVQKLVSNIKGFDASWKAMELDEQKAILRSIIKEIRAGDGRIEVDFIL